MAAVTRGLWLTLENDADMPAAYCGTLRADFKHELVDALTEYWRGAPAIAGVNGM